MDLSNIWLGLVLFTFSPLLLSSFCALIETKHDDPTATQPPCDCYSRFTERVRNIHATATAVMSTTFTTMGSPSVMDWQPDPNAFAHQPTYSPFYGRGTKRSATQAELEDLDAEHRRAAWRVSSLPSLSEGNSCQD